MRRRRTRSKAHQPRRDGVQPCSCGANRWQTVDKQHEVYRCRECGLAREVLYL